LERLDLTMKKIFLLLTINKRSKLVTEETVKEGMSIFPYLLESYGVIGEQLAATEMGDDESFVLNVVTRLSKQGRQPTPRDVFQSARRRIANTTIIIKILQNFVTLGILEEFKVPAGPKGGKPKTVYIPAAGTQNVLEH